MYALNLCPKYCQTRTLLCDVQLLDNPKICIDLLVHEINIYISTAIQNLMKLRNMIDSCHGQ